MESRKRFSSPDGNMFDLLDRRSLHVPEVPFPVLEPYARRALQMHSSLVQRLVCQRVMEGHQGCVNSLAWNAQGTLLISGSDDTRVNLWDYGSLKLSHSIDTGHTANIFCTKFLPETGDDVVVSGAADAEVRVHRVTRSKVSSARASFSEQCAVFRCHTRRVKKLAVETGNPHVIWSASEDGTLRQHDLRERVSCPANGATDDDCRNILLDLRNGAKKSLQASPRHSLRLMTCAISPTQPHFLLIGGSDAFARLYDRRKLSPPTASRQQPKTPPCVRYFCPAHLSDHTRSGLHLTHVVFSPNGQEVLLSYSGEHVYLMDAICGQEDPVVYRARDLPKRMMLTPTANGAESMTLPLSSGTVGYSHRHNFAWLLECNELLQEAKGALEEGKNYTYAIEAVGEVIDAGGPVVGAALRHDCLCVRAAALLKRGWKNDVHMAIRDCNEARAINPMSTLAHHNIAEALSQLGRYAAGLEFAMRAHHLNPLDKKLSEHVTQLRAKINKAEETGVKQSKENETKSERWTSRRRLTDLLFRSERDHSDVSSLDMPLPGGSDRDDLDYFDDDMEMEMEVEMSVGEHGERDRGDWGWSGSVRLRSWGETGEQESVRGGSSGMSTDEISDIQTEVAIDMRQRYVGHCNTGTDIKQASFLGENGEYVASGSDDGRWFIWQKKTGRLIKILVGDENVVNCVQSHPFDCAIATSGIDNTIKLWTPRAGEPSIVAAGEAGPEPVDAARVMAENQLEMRRHQEIGLPMELLQRFRVQEGGEHPFQCTQS
ncbi:hypothetical protein BDL97_07G105500 [Sphagnum fallax]|nr:hypothetical protein BDL97_07G105500 [Sphagnum fallax]KAH8957688.1 hypothetical protein BDL97_07G105500 [Sphagnum fallax]KAH8957691.1 hypothetical protein BDL97_07G105500 [Sphagnum fallax]